jgi:hypothetical protein
MTERREDLTDQSSDELSLLPVIQTLWSYRRGMFIAIVATLVSYIGVMLWMFVRLPSDRVATLQFQLTFAGADQDQYPNGTRFSSAEIVSTPVLTDVFKANDIQRYAPFSDFKDSMFVLQANRDLELLSYEYQAKLSDSRLSPVDRARIEEEFRKKRESLKSAQYSLSIRRSEGMVKVPVVLLNKILQDTLSTWARQAAERKGAVRYDIPVLSKNVLKKDFLVAEDYIIAVDILRTTIERILKTLTQIEEIPGASAVRMGPEQIGLADLRANLEDQLRFKVEPLLNIIRTSGLSRNPIRMDQYFEGRLFDVQLAQTETSQRIKALQEALRGYERPSAPEAPPAGEGRTPAMTPQLSESFIDRLVQLSTQSVDVKYRQDLTKKIIDDGMLLAELSRQTSYYESMRRSFGSARAGANAGSEADVTRRTGQTFDDLARSMDQVQAIYELICRQNLNPDTVLYSITSPFSVRTTSSLSLQTALLYLFVTLFAAMIVIPLACLAHDYFRHWISPTHPAHTDTPPASGTGHVAGL